MPLETAAWPSTMAVSVMAASIWLAASAVNMLGVSGKTFTSGVGFSLLATKSAPVVACCTPMRKSFILALSTAVPFFTSTPMSEWK